jgi:hypothetical protein
MAQLIDNQSTRVPVNRLHESVSQRMAFCPHRNPPRERLSFNVLLLIEAISASPVTVRGHLRFIGSGKLRPITSRSI